MIVRKKPPIGSTHLVNSEGSEARLVHRGVWLSNIAHSSTHLRVSLSDQPGHGVVRTRAQKVCGRGAGIVIR